MEVEGRDGRSVYNLIWIAFKHEENFTNKEACALAARL